MQACEVETVSPENKMEAENTYISLSRKTTTRRAEDMEHKLLEQNKCRQLDWYYFALDRSTAVTHTAQLLLLILFVNDDVDITHWSQRKTLQRRGLGDESERVHLEAWASMWKKLISVTTDGSPYLTGKNDDLLTRSHRTVHGTSSGHKVTFLHYTIHREAPGNHVLDMNLVVNLKLVTQVFCG